MFRRVRGETIKIYWFKQSIKTFSSPLIEAVENWELAFLTLGCGNFKLQEDEKEGNGKRKESYGLVMANLNLLVFLNLRKYREDQTKGWG